MVYWYLPWHLPILPPPILSIFFTLMPPSVSNVQRRSFLYPTAHIPPPISSYIPLTPPTASHTKPKTSELQASSNPHQSHTSSRSYITKDMEFLEFQFEPISFRFYSLPASSTGGSLLTWIAVLAAAAVGFWRIRTVGSKTDGSDTSPLFTTPLEETQTKVAPLLQSTENKASVSPSCSVDRPIEIVGTPKVRFTTYFEKQDDCIGSCHVEDEVEEPTVDDDKEFGHQEVELLWEREEVEVKWEGIAPVRRRGDLGWYSYQDMAALNGSVVRLWDGESPRRRKGCLKMSAIQ